MKDLHDDQDEERDLMDEQFEKTKHGIAELAGLQPTEEIDRCNDLCKQIAEQFNVQFGKQEVIIEFLRNEMMLERERSAMPLSLNLIHY